MTQISYLVLTKRIKQDELTNEELVECLDIPNVLVLQHAILKLVEKGVRNPNVCRKLVEYSQFMDIQFKILGLCRIGHLAVFALKRLGYIEAFQELYEALSSEDQEQVMILEKALSDI